MDIETEFSWDRKSRRFRATSGKFVSRPTVRKALDAALDSASKEARGYAEQLADGTINASEFTLRLRALTKNAIVASAAIGSGGRDQLTPADLGRVGSRVREAYSYIANLAREIESGLPLDGKFHARVAMHPLAGTGAYEAILRAGDIEAGFTEEKRRLGPNENHCGECVDEARKGWQPAGTLKEIGSCQCLTRCGCSFESRRPKDAAMSGETPSLDGHWSRFLALFGISQADSKPVGFSAIVKKGGPMGLLAMFREWTKKDRESIDESDMGEPPDGFPIEDDDDIEAASHLIGKSSDPEKVKARIIEIAKRKGLTIPDAWKSVADKAAMSGTNPSALGGAPGKLRDLAMFDLATSEASTDGQWVSYRNSTLFRPGNYANQKFAMTDAELESAVSAFSGPVPNELDHTNTLGISTILDGKLGHVEDVRFERDDDGAVMRGTVKIPRWLDRVWDSPTKQVSCVWDRATKTLDKLGLVVKGQVAGAALFGELPETSILAAFSAAHPEQVAGSLPALFADRTYQGMSLLQSLHDTCAAGGACCKSMNGKDGKSAAMSSEALAAFHSAPELKSLQSIHDAACEGGACCRMMSDEEMGRRYERSSGMFAAFTDRKKHEHITNVMQGCHDMIAMHPGGCPADPGSDGDGQGQGSGASVAFGDTTEQHKALRKMHQITVEHGACCPATSGGKSSFSQTDENPMKDALIKAVGALPDKPTDEDIKILLAAFPKDMLPKVASFAAAPAPDRWAKFANDPDFLAYQREQDSKAKADRDRLDRLESERETERSANALKAAQVEAAAFCAPLMLGGVHVSNLASVLFSATEVDRQHSPKVTFSDAGKLTEDGKLADAIRVFVGNLPRSQHAPVPIDGNGKLDHFAARALFNDVAPPDEAAKQAAEEREVLSYTEAGRERLAEMNKKGA